MTLCESLQEYARVAAQASSVPKLPRARPRSCASPARTKIGTPSDMFTRPRARAPLMENKTMGMALIDLSDFKNTREYLATVKEKDCAGHHRAGIYCINTSSRLRQGRPMNTPCLTLQTEYEEAPRFRSVGVFNAHGIPTGYCAFGGYGNFAAADRLPQPALKSIKKRIGFQPNRVKYSLS